MDIANPKNLTDDQIAELLCPWELTPLYNAGLSSSPADGRPVTIPVSGEPRTSDDVEKSVRLQVKPSWLK